MSFLANVLSFLTSDLKTTLITLLIGFIVYKIAKFYHNFLSLPPGPIPLPIIGNLLYFRGTKEHWNIELRKLSPKYGPIFTFHMGPKPYVVIRDIDLARDAFRRNDFTGRPDTLFGFWVNDENGCDVAFTDYGHTWEALRRVSHSAAQKYSTSDKLVDLAIDCVDHTFNLMIKREGFDKPFVPFEYIYHLFLNILATSAYGKGFDIDDKEYKQYKYAFKDFFEENGQRFIFWDFLPILRRIDRKKFNSTTKMFNDIKKLMKTKFISHINSYDESVDRDFCDALISAKNDALKEGKESAPYLTDNNLSLTVFDMLVAGTDTSRLTFRWLLLFCLYYPEINEKLRQEIESQIGDRMPTHEDRNRCHYVMAFISETMRFRTVVPIGLPHKAVVRCELGKYTIPEGTGVFVYQGHILMDEKYWSNPDQFNPDRFIENGEYMKTRSSAFIPFGVGRRVCLGEKLAISDLFIVLVRFVQKMNEYNVKLHSHKGIGVNPNAPEGFDPFDYEIIFSKN